MLEKKLAKTISRNFILNKANILARTRVKIQEIAYSAIHLSKENGSHEKSLGDCETKGVLGAELTSGLSLSLLRPIYCFWFKGGVGGWSQLVA